MTAVMPGWSVLEDPEVDRVCRQKAAKVARHYEQDADDLYQEAQILVATKPDLQVVFDPTNNHGIAVLAYRLDRDLANLAKSAKTKADRNTSYEERNKDAWDDSDRAPRPANIAIRNDVSAYTRELVESLIPAVWDESFCFGIRVENAPDPDMPRGATNKSTGNTLAAHIADIKVGWVKAPLDLTERRVLLLGYGFDYSQQEIAAELGISQSSVSRALYKGVGKIVSCLNGDLALMFQLCDDCTCSGDQDHPFGQRCGA